MNVESKVLIDLKSVKRDRLNLRKSGVDKVLPPVDNTISNYFDPELVTQAPEN